MHSKPKGWRPYLLLDQDEFTYLLFSIIKFLPLIVYMFLSAGCNMQPARTRSSPPALNAALQKHCCDGWRRWCRMPNQSSMLQQTIFLILYQARCLLNIIMLLNTGYQGRPTVHLGSSFQTIILCSATKTDLVWSLIIASCCTTY